MSLDDAILTRALELTPHERAELARQLLLSLDAEAPDDDAQDAWAAELEARLSRTSPDAPAGSDWREAIERVRKSLKPGPGA